MSNSSYDVPGPVTARLDDQGSLEPGTPGYWEVWGASARDIRPGDLVMSGWKDRDDPSVIHHAEYEVAEMAPWGMSTVRPGEPDLRDSCRVRFLTTAGTFASVGMLQPLALLRPGTHNTLSDYAR